jgi:hypothetical protein
MTTVITGCAACTEISLTARKTVFLVFDNDTTYIHSVYKCDNTAELTLLTCQFALKFSFIFSSV